ITIDRRLTASPMLALLAAFCMLVPQARAQQSGAAPPAAAGATPATASPSAAAATPAVPKKSPYKPEGVPRSGRDFIAVTKGVNDMKVRRTNAGNLIRFSYRVINPDLAKTLNDKKATPYLIGHTSHAVLQVPVVDKVGPLRQSTTPETGKEYWVMFSNK